MNGGYSQMQKPIEATREMGARLQAMEQARMAIVAVGQNQGSIPCPVCGHALHYAVMPNTHVHARCVTLGCLRWLE